MATKRSSRRSADYKSVKLTTGETVKVHRVPESIINSIVPETPRPKRPSIPMKTKGGVQHRPAKSEDPEYGEWVDAKEAWEEERDELQSDYRICQALHSYPIPDPLVFPDHIQELIDDNILEVPTEGKHAKYRARAMWLMAAVLDAFVDETEIFYATQELAGIDSEVVAQMREKFRRGLSGEIASSMGEGSEPADSGEPDENA